MQLEHERYKRQRLISLNLPTGVTDISLHYTPLGHTMLTLSSYGGEGRLNPPVALSSRNYIPASQLAGGLGGNRPHRGVCGHFCERSHAPTEIFGEFLKI